MRIFSLLLLMSLPSYVMGMLARTENSHTQEKKIEQWVLFINSKPRPIHELRNEIKATLANRFNRETAGLDIYQAHILFQASEDEIPTLFKNKEWFKKENLEKDEECYPCKKN